MKKTSGKKLRLMLNLNHKELISLVGGGGKSSLMFTLAEELMEDGFKVISTTTTKVRYREALRAPCLISETASPEFLREVERSLIKDGHIFVAREILDIGKVDGISPEVADTLFETVPVDCLITEADGAAGLPLKAHASHEPVIPSASTTMIAVAGLEAIGRPFGPEIVFRHEIFEAVTGIKRGENLSVERIAAIFFNPEGLFRDVPISARKIVFLNKIDLLENKREAVKLAETLLSNHHVGIERVIIGSLQKMEYTVFTQDLL
jgi:probable selenium-dependent hydroxylase accessory protein YqeC